MNNETIKTVAGELPTIPAVPYMGKVTMLIDLNKQVEKAETIGQLRGKALAKFIDGLGPDLKNVMDAVIDHYSCTDLKAGGRFLERVKNYWVKNQLPRIAEALPEGKTLGFTIKRFEDQVLKLSFKDNATARKSTKTGPKNEPKDTNKNGEENVEENVEENGEGENENENVEPGTPAHYTSARKAVARLNSLDKAKLIREMLPALTDDERAGLVFDICLEIDVKLTDTVKKRLLAVGE